MDGTAVCSYVRISNLLLVIHCVHWLHEHTALHNIMLTLHRLGIALQCHVTVTEALVSCASHARHIDITTRA